MRPPEIIDTPRLRLRPPVMEDALSILEQYAQDSEVTRYLIWRPHQDIEETHDFLRRCISAWNNGSTFAWVLSRKEDSGLVGMLGAQTT